MDLLTEIKSALIDKAVIDVGVSEHILSKVMPVLLDATKDHAALSIMASDAMTGILTHSRRGQEPPMTAKSAVEYAVALQSELQEVLINENKTVAIDAG